LINNELYFEELNYDSNSESGELKTDDKSYDISDEENHGLKRMETIKES
jgi:hypothetical protein